MNALDPTIVAAITAAVKSLASAVATGAAGAAGKALWDRVKRVMDWETQPPDLPQIPKKIAEALEKDPPLAKPLLAELQTERTEAWGQLVGHIEADKVIVAGRIEIVNM